jgi:outer membrane protein OmpA-like peptidoglycan-associated protein
MPSKPFTEALGSGEMPSLRKDAWSDGLPSGAVENYLKGFSPMTFTRMLAVPALALVTVLVGCNDTQKAAEADLLTQNEALTKQLEDKNLNLNAMGEQLARAQQQTTELESQLEACNQRAAAPNVEVVELATVTANDFQGIEGVEATVQGDEIHLTIANSLLFDSGRTSLKDSARKSLDKVSSAIKNKFSDREIIVVGYTDADPIRKSSYPTNYHLGFERAFAVRGYLDRKGVVGAHMGLMSFGPDRPEASKEKSRRVEVIVTSKTANKDVSAMKTESPRNAPTAAGKVDATKATASRPAAVSSTKSSATSKTTTNTSSSRKATAAPATTGK